MNRTMLTGAFAALLLLVGADLWESYQSRQESLRARHEAKQMIDSMGELRKRVGSLEYVNARLERYKKSRKDGKPAAEATKEAAGVIP